MTKEEIRKMRFKLGKFLHDYYIKFGDEKYDDLLEKIGISMSSMYGDAFTSENLRIMEAEYVTFSKLNDRKRKKDQRSS